MVKKDQNLANIVKEWPLTTNLALTVRTNELTYLAEHASNEIIVRHIILVNLIHVRIRIQILISGQFEETSIGIKGRLEDFISELTEEASTIYTSFIKTSCVHKHYAHFQSQIGLCNER